MSREEQITAERPTGAPNATPVERVIAGGKDWRLTELTCHAGPHDRRFEERHGDVAIAAVVAGSFTYSTDSGRALLHPGALLLGNSGACFECGHDHSIGDRCVSFQISPEYFAEISATAAGSARYRFQAAMLPVARRVTPAIVRLETMADGDLPLRIEEAVASLATTVLATISGHTASRGRTSPRDERRVVEVVRFMEEHATEPLDLDRLASVAYLSKYHFLRTFRRTIGVSPYQFLLTLRMRRAALRLVSSRESIAVIGYESGFGDLSTFNGHFRQLFGTTPRAYRGRKSAPIGKSSSPRQNSRAGGRDGGNRRHGLHDQFRQAIIAALQRSGVPVSRVRARDLAWRLLDQA
jgi:AraC-like DNA-binding protein